ncbi:MAG TPA: hypothetical protein VJT71_15800 [Pyrinomonadaceae bacterium]|nr:hypothetical protein [Pyrinomonadaceae bacterium]
MARWDSGNEFSYLNDERCSVKFRYEIAVNFGGAGPDEAMRTHIATIQSHEYGGRAIITAVGILRNPGRYYGYYRYSFEILKLESVANVVRAYEGTLEAGKTYRATVRGDRAWGLAPVPVLQMVIHQSVYIGWTNLSDFPELAKLGENSQRQIVFSVISDETQRMTERRWSRSLECKIIRIE